MAYDLIALRELLHDDLIYIHAMGVRHDRAQRLTFVATGPLCLAGRPG